MEPANAFLDTQDKLPMLVRLALHTSLYVKIALLYRVVINAQPAIFTTLVLESMVLAKIVKLTGPIVLYVRRMVNVLNVSLIIGLTLKDNALTAPTFA